MSLPVKLQRGGTHAEFLAEFLLLYSPYFLSPNNVYFIPATPELVKEAFFSVIIVYLGSDESLRVFWTHKIDWLSKEEFS